MGIDLFRFSLELCAVPVRHTIYIPLTSGSWAANCSHVSSPGRYPERYDWNAPQRPSENARPELRSTRHWHVRHVGGWCCVTLCNTSSTLENQAKDNLFPALLTDLESSGFRSKGAMAAMGIHISKREPRRFNEFPNQAPGWGKCRRCDVYWGGARWLGHSARKGPWCSGECCFNVQTAKNGLGISATFSYFPCPCWSESA